MCHGEKVSIAVVDDDPRIVESVALHLGELDCSVARFSDPVKLLGEARAFRLALFLHRRGAALMKN